MRKKKQQAAVKAKLEERRKQKEMTRLGVDNGRGSTLPDVDVHTDIVRTPRTRSPATITPTPAAEECAMAQMPDPPQHDPSSDDKKKKKKDKKKDKKKKKDKEAVPSDSPV